MGMKEEFYKARDWVKNDLTYSHASDVSVFETTIRELGGLLSAYDLSGDEIFKIKVRRHLFLFFVACCLVSLFFFLYMCCNI